MSLQDLAQMMGQSESDVAAFVECLKIWIDKGFTLEESIEKHMSQMNRLAERSNKLPSSLVVDTFYPV